MSVGVVIGRFQVPSLHKGHLKLLREAQKEGRLVVLVGTTVTRLTTLNPLSFGLVRKMIKDKFPLAEVLSLPDIYDDDKWSNSVDEVIGQYGSPILYCSRDSFKDSYTGKFPVKVIKEVPSISGTLVRRMIGRFEKDDKCFREGVIWASQYRWPTPFPTVDIALLRKTDGGTLLLLGKKQGMDKWVLPGGFVDVADLSLELAAARELREEVGRVETHEFQYIGSTKIPDRRYAGTNDGIMTSLFVTWMMGGKEPCAGDDLDEVMWFTIEEAKTAIAGNHFMLLQKVINYLNNNK